MGNNNLPRNRIEARHQQVVKLTRQGCSAAQIADRLNITRRTVVRIRKLHGIAQPPLHRYSAEEIAAIEQLLDDGCSLAEVARTIGRPAPYLWRRYAGRGWTPSQAGQFGNMLRKMGI